MNKKTIFLAVLLLLLIAGWLIFKNIIEPPKQQEGELPVIVKVLPKNAKVVVVDGKDLKNNFTNYLKPGKYTVEVSANNFKKETKTITVKSGLRPKIITILQSNDGKDRFTLNEKLMLEKASGEASYEYTKAYQEKYPAVNFLPYTDPYYKIGYLSTDGTDFYITVYTSSPRYRHNALKKIRSLGIDPAYYKIKFMDYKLPLKEAR